ncbi:MAG: MFS transporter [Rhodospirillales bacterium]|nr:MFS transporter [Rhodospirillales bacterium]
MGKDRAGRLPAALKPLENPVFRSLFAANLITSLGTWMQNTGAGWLMTTLRPNALTVSLVQAATILPVCLLALPAGAIADIVDRRRFLILTQIEMLAAAALLAVLTAIGAINAWILLALTFAVGVGNAMNGPAWAAIIPETVPRGDLGQAVALNGVSFNIARALGPAVAGGLVAAFGPALAFALNALSFLSPVQALAVWRRPAQATNLPREHVLGAMAAGIRFVRHTPRVQAAILRVSVYYLPAAAPWALLPLVVKEQLHLGAGVFGALLGLMGAGAVGAGMLLPTLHRRFPRGDLTMAASLISCIGMLLLALSRHWPLAALAMLLFGTGWVIAGSLTQAATQLVAPPWVRARALGIYQLFANAALVLGAFGWGWLGTRVGLHWTMATASVLGIGLALGAGRFALEAVATRTDAPPLPAAFLARARGQILETQHYRVPPEARERFLAVMAEVQHVRGRAGARFWQLQKDLARRDGWLEIWGMPSWTEHLREAARLSEDDRGVLARACAFQTPEGAERPCRYIAVEPVPPRPRREHQRMLPRSPPPK